MGRYDEALADFNRAIELDPGDDDYITKRAEIQRHIGSAEPTVLQTAPRFTQLLDLSHVSWRTCVADQPDGSHVGCCFGRWLLLIGSNLVEAGLIRYPLQVLRVAVSDWPR